MASDELSNEHPDPNLLDPPAVSDGDDGLSEPDNEQLKSKLLDSAKKVVRSRDQRKKKKESFDWSSHGALVLGTVLLVVIILYALSGFNRHQKKPVTVHEESVIPAVVKYGGADLPGKAFIGLEAIRSDRTPELVDEIKKVIASRGTPGDVFADDVPPERNIARELSKEFKIYQQNPGELEQLRREVPVDQWSIGKETLGKVADILERVEPKRQKIRELLMQKDICFSFEFINDPDYGDIPDTGASDFLADYAILEEFAIARALADAQPARAVESLAFLFRLTQLAAEVKNPGVRTKAAQIRMHTVDVLQAVVMDPNLKEKELAQLYLILQEQLDDWTPDADAWIGDRASGMKVYNQIVQYGIDAALNQQEIEELVLRGAVVQDKKDRLQLTNHRSLARDQVFYLKSMQSVIDSCSEPYFQRLTTLGRIDEQVRNAQGTEEETIIAEILLRGIRELMQYCTQDRARCEAATLAMASSLRNSNESVPGRDGLTLAQRAKGAIESLSVDPLYGKPYEIRRIKGGAGSQANLVWVSYRDNLKPFRAPDYSETPQPR